MDVFTAASHQDILHLVVHVGVLLLAARGLGYGARMLGQPAVVGELLAGILLGPSLLSGVFPELGAWIVPQTEIQGYLLEVVALIGAMFLLLATGLETDLALIRRHARTAIGVSWGGITVTFASGFALGQVLPDFLLADTDQRLVFALFVATAMSISAIPVIAKVLMDLGLMRRDIGQTIIAAGMSDDTIGWILLSVVAGLAAGEAVTAGSVISTVGTVLAFLVVSFTFGRYAVRWLLRFAQDRRASPDALTTLVVGLTFLWGAATQAMNLEAVLGAFVMGTLFGQMPTLPESVHHRVVTLSSAVFTPIFFAVAGLKVDAAGLLDPTLFLITVGVIAVATVGKVVGTYVGARVIGGKSHWSALPYGAGLNARGAMEIIIATVGLQLGILTQQMFTVIVVMAIVTSLMAPFALRFVLRRVEPEKEELARLRREELAAGTLPAAIRRVLLPIRQRQKPGLETIEASLLRQMAQDHPFSVTLLTVCQPGERPEASRFLGEVAKVFEGMEVQRRVVESRDIEKAIGDEADKYYDMMVLGAPEKASSSEVLFNPLVDLLVRTSPCPTMVVSHGEPRRWPPRRILVPTNGSKASRKAAELAFALIGNGSHPAEAGVAGEESSDDAKVVFLQVVVDSSRPLSLESRESRHSERIVTVRQIVEGLAQEATDRGIRGSGEVLWGSDPESMILDYAKRNSMDLILLGTDVRPGSHRLFLGPRVEWVLEHAECPVVVLNAG
jgi:Kef-type K+ transport system membrane component KefB/nucleotide-binding universal stress UspA family protein